MTRTPTTTDEEELSELPPLDGEVDDDSEPEVEVEEESTLDGIDDTLGPHGDTELDAIDLDENEESWLSEDTDSEDLDLGAGALFDLGTEGSSVSDLEEAEGPSEGDLAGDSSEDIELDGGEEGPLAPDDELRDEDLPALDADGDGELEDAAFMDEGFSSEEPLGLPWATRPWNGVGAPLDLGSATAVACVPRGALVAARNESGASELSRVDLEGSRETLAAEGAANMQLSTIAAEGHRIAGVSSDGRLLVSHDGGCRFEPAATGIAVADALYASGTLWLRTASGGLLASSDGGRNFTRHPAAGTIAAVAKDGASAMAALVVDDGHRAVALIRCAGGANLEREPMDGPRVGAPTMLAVRGRHVAYASPSRIARQMGGGWRSYSWDGRITALAFVDEEGTLLAATYSTTEDTTALICLDAAGGASVVARIGAAPRQDDTGERLVPRGDGRVLALACDDARGVVWAVGDFGVAAFAVAPL
ncbi:MAG TPA: hypothetical protein VEK07_00150 [Polyangiaceae bacterium]|nr:hypothetical protein [Polyangiaceae bacterium]